jgi:hypothetical protein
LSRSHRKLQTRKDKNKQKTEKYTNLRTEFLLQIRKQREDSAIILASNRPQHKDKTKNRPTEKEEQNFKGKEGTNKEQLEAMQLEAM